MITSRAWRGAALLCLVVPLVACSATDAPAPSAPAAETSAAVVEMVMCVGESAEHPPGSTVRVDVEDGGEILDTTFMEVPGQLDVPLPSPGAQLLVDGTPWLRGHAADDPLHADGAGCPAQAPPGH